MAKKHKIPKCPDCKDFLTYLDVQIYENYDFDKEEGRYIENGMAGDIKVQCPSCNTDITDIFPEGVCNFGS